MYHKTRNSLSRLSAARGIQGAEKSECGLRGATVQITKANVGGIDWLVDGDTCSASVRDGDGVIPIDGQSVLCLSNDLATLINVESTIVVREQGSLKCHLVVRLGDVARITVYAAVPGTG